MTTRWMSATIAAAAVGLTGCGGGSDSDQVKSTVSGYVSAVADGDGGKACDKLSNSTKASFEKAGHKSCSAVFAQLIKNPQIAALRSTLRSVKVSATKVSGNTASASLNIKGQSSQVALIKEGGNWKIQNPIGG